MTTGQEERIRALEEQMKFFLDKEAIIRTLHEYVHVMETGRDVDQWNDLFTKDGVWKGEPITSTAGSRGDRLEGHKQLGEWWLRAGRDKPEFWAPGAGPAMHHNVVVVDVRIDGDRAEVQSNLLITREHPDGPIIFGIGVWNDVLVRCPDGKWRFKIKYLQRTGAIPEFQVRPMTTPDPKEQATMTERWRRDLEASKAKHRS